MSFTSYGSNTTSDIGYEAVPQVIILTPGYKRPSEPNDTEKEDEDEEDLQVQESNELLNGSTELKMKDFDRVDSEEDMLDYEDGVKCEPKCDFVRRRTPLEIILFVLLLVFLIIIIVVASLKAKTPKETEYQCQTQACVEAANSILSAMDPLADPCVDFYQYACGGWLKDNPAPPGYDVWDRFQQLSYQNLYRLKNLIEQRIMGHETEKKVQVFYNSCMKESKIHRGQTRKEFQSLLANITGSPEFVAIASLLELVNTYNTWPLFKVSVGADEREPDKNILEIGIGEFGLPLNTHVEETTPPTSLPVNKSQSDEPKSKRSVDVSEYLMWNDTVVSERFLRETRQVLMVLLNKTEQEAATLSQEMLTFERKVVQSYLSSAKHSFPVRVSMAKLQEICKVSQINWIMYLHTIVPNLPNDAEVMVQNQDAFSSVCTVIEEYILDPSRESMLNVYFEVRLATNLMKYFEAYTFDEDINFDQDLFQEGEHWRRCTHYTNKALGFGTGAIYINGLEKRGTVSKLKQLVHEVKSAFKDYLLRKVWLDAETRAEAVKKLDTMLEKISYPDYILDPVFLDNYYKSMVVSDDWLENVIHWQRFQVTKMFDQLHHSRNRTSWINPPITVESDYSPTRNDVIFPIAMFHLPFFSFDGPSALNYGAIGSVIGHEITHAFDIKGSQYDGVGRMRQWWSEHAASRFRTSTTCLKTQYDSFKIQGFPVNGERTLDENIADNGGIRAAFIAYQLWEKKMEKREKLPGINMTDHQLFFVSYAQMFCSKYTEKGLKEYLIDDPHSPGPLRVLGSVSNTDSFRSEFMCPFISNYSPQTKCEVW